MSDNRISKKNHEGYSDPTAYNALSGLQKEQDEADIRLSLLIRTLKNTIDLADFELLERIELRDRRTGRKYF